jgi:predicted transcriptional regulator
VNYQKKQKKSCSVLGITILIVLLYDKNRTMAREKDIHITETELEILQILWDRKAATVKDVHEQLNKKREAVYTTTLKQMQVMYEKGLLTRDDKQRQHIYHPAVQQNKVQKRFMDKMMNIFFQGSASQLVLQALDQYKTSPEELEHIKSIIEKAKNSKK